MAKKKKRLQLYAHDVRNILNDIWDSNDIMQEQTVNGITKKISLKEYLNVELFAFRSELKSTDNKSTYADYNEWFEAAIKAVDKSFARCNIISEENTIAHDIDFAALQIDYEIIIQPEKLEAFEVYWNNLRKIYLGMTYPLTTFDGQGTQLFITIGNLILQDGMDTSQIGNSIVLTATIAITSLVGGITYNDYEIRLLFGDDLTQTWYKIAYTNLTRGVINTGEKVNTQLNPHQIGHIPQMNGFVMTMTLYDMKNGANAILNDIALRAISLAERTVKEPTDILATFEPIVDYEPPTIGVRIWNRLTRKEYITQCYPISIEQTTVNGSFSAISVSLTLAAQNVDYINHLV